MLEMLVMTVATVMCCVSALYRDRAAMLWAGVACSVIFLGYWAWVGEHTATAIAATALTGTLVQVAIPDRLLARTFWLRLSGMIGLACVCFALTYESASDILPLLAFTAARIGETMQKGTHIRCGYFASAILWFCFAASIGNELSMIANVVIFAAQVYAQLRDVGVFLVRPRLAFQAVR